MEYGAEMIVFNKGDVIFEYGETPRYYYQLLEGKIVMQNTDEKGKVQTQGMVLEGSGNLFGIAPILAQCKYPATALVAKKSKIFKIPIVNLRQLLKESPEEMEQLLTKLAGMLCNKAALVSTLSLASPQERILKILRTQIKEKAKGEYHRINLTRQEIANLTALRVETVIRSIKALEKQGALKIKNHRVYFKK